jgi:hypothetical protein
LWNVQWVRRIFRLGVAVAHNVKTSLGEDCGDFDQGFVDALLDWRISLQGSRFE